MISHAGNAGTTDAASCACVPPIHYSGAAEVPIPLLLTPGAHTLSLEGRNLYGWQIAVVEEICGYGSWVKVRHSAQRTHSFA